MYAFKHKYKDKVGWGVVQAMEEEEEGMGRAGGCRE